jgi:hypothetical protein
MRDFSLFRLERESEGHGGLLTAIHNSLLASELPPLPNTKIEHQIIKISRGDQSVHIINVYDRLGQLDETFYRGVLNLHNAIVVGDFNAHHLSWGGRYTNRKGADLLKLIDECAMVVHNDGSYTHLGPHGTSALDLSITSPQLSKNLVWENSLEFLQSDHSIIRLADARSPPPADPVVEGQHHFNLKKANWPLFTSLCDAAIQSIELNDPDQACEELEQLIIDAAKTAIPTISQSSKLKSVPWWNNDCADAIKARNKHRNRYARTKFLDDFIQYKRAQAVSRRVIIDAQISYWQGVCSDLNAPDRSKLWRLVKGMKGTSSRRRPIRLLDAGSNSLVTDPSKVASRLADQFDSASSDSNHSPEFLSHKCETAYDSSFMPPDDRPYNSPIQPWEVESVVGRRKDSAVGVDSISYSMIKNLPRSAMLHIIAFFNLLWERGVIPSRWKSSIIVPILKPQKDAKLASSFRPISLTSCFCKIYESVINNRLKWHLESSNLLNPLQSGFRNKRSTNDQICSIVDDISKSLATKQSTCAVFLDISKAYDMVWREGLLIKVRGLGISGPMFNFIQSFIFNRKCKVRVSGHFSDAFCPVNGLPQGSVISPTLFLLMVNDVPVSTPMSIFADDMALWKSSTNHTFTANQVQKGVDALSTWSDEWGFNFSHEKTKYIMFSNKRSDPNIELWLKGHKLEKVNQYKFLGVILDKKLSFKYHISSVVAKCQSIINLMRSIRGSKWGADPKSLMLIFKSHIVAFVTYAAPVFLLACKSQLGKLAAVYNRGLKVACRVWKFANPHALHVLSGVPPLRLQVLQHALKYFIRSASYSLQSRQSIQYSWHAVFKKSDFPLFQEVSAPFFKQFGFPSGGGSTVASLPPLGKLPSRY